ncbi:MAG: hypothetical protein IJM07_01300, partial [Pyramidobacter sp.]|nr:hypothetical protein [Pyramidobacter sp.]
VFCSQPQPNGFPLKESDPAFEEEVRAYLDRLPPLLYEMHEGQLENMLTALETDGLPFISGEDGRRTIELITAIYEAGATHCPVSLPLKPDDPFYTVQGVREHVPHFYEKNKSVTEFDGEISFGGFGKGK